MFEIVWNHQPVITFRHYFNGLSCEHPGRGKLPVSGALLAAWQVTQRRDGAEDHAFAARKMPSWPTRYGDFSSKLAIRPWKIIILK